MNFQRGSTVYRPIRDLPDRATMREKAATPALEKAVKQALG